MSRAALARHGALACMAAGVFMCAQPVLAGPGADAITARDYARAWLILAPQAARGDSEAQFLAAGLLEQGLGQPVDLARARAWYAQAAAKGHRKAREALASFDSRARVMATPTSIPTPPPVPTVPAGDAPTLQAMLGGGLPADGPRAARLAAAIAPEAERDPDLAVLLGEYFESALAGAPDFPAAALWYERAARRGHAIALNNLGAMFYDGRGVLQSFAEARRLYQRGADAGDAVAQYNLALMLGQGRGGAVEQDAMVTLLGKSAAQGYARAQAQLGRLYFEGIGVTGNMREAARHFELAARQGLPNAQFWYGRLVSRGDGVARDLTAGGEWILKAAEAGLPQAMHEAGVILEIGLGRVSDFERALALFRKAGERGVRESALRLAKAYAEGDLGVKANPEEARRWSALAQ